MPAKQVTGIPVSLKPAEFLVYIIGVPSIGHGLPASPFGCKSPFGDLQDFYRLLLGNDHNAVVIPEYVIAGVHEHVVVNSFHVDGNLVVDNHKTTERFHRVTEPAEGWKSHVNQVIRVARGAINDRTHTSNRRGGCRTDFAELPARKVALRIPDLYTPRRHAFHETQPDVMRFYVPTGGRNSVHGKRRPRDFHRMQ